MSNRPVVASDYGGGILNTPKKSDDLESTLLEALEIINGERQDQYGSPEDSFALIAEYWNVYLNLNSDMCDPKPITSLDVAHMMTLFKIARMSGQKPKRDNYTDACGYLAIAADRLLKEVE